MVQELPTVRRIVTGITPGGKSRIVEDTAAPATFTVPERPGCKVSNVWVTQDSPVPIAEADGTGTYRGLHPPARRTVIRIMDIPPEEKDPVKRAAAARATAAVIFPDIHRIAADRSQPPGMHTTDTVDYAICLEGELCLELDNGAEVTLTPGTCVVQLGTRHVWRNKSDRPALMCYVQIGAVRG